MDFLKLKRRTKEAASRQAKLNRYLNQGSANNLPEIRRFTTIMRICGAIYKSKAVSS